MLLLKKVKVMIDHLMVKVVPVYLVWGTMSIVDEFLCTGDSIDAETDPIDNRSKRTSVPFLEG